MTTPITDRCVIGNSEATTEDYENLAQDMRALEQIAGGLAEAIAAFNAGCKSACEARSKNGTLCEAYQSRNRSCPDCPNDDVIECAALAKFQAMKEAK